MDVKDAAVLVGELDPAIDLVADVNAGLDFPILRQDRPVGEHRGDLAAGIDDRLHQPLAGQGTADIGQVRPDLIAAAFELVATETTADAEVIENPLSGLSVAFAFSELEPGRQVVWFGLVLGSISHQYALS